MILLRVATLGNLSKLIALALHNLYNLITPGAKRP